MKSFLKGRIRTVFFLATTFVLTTSVQQVQSTNQQYYWMKLSAKDKFQRSVIAAMGASIEIVKDDYVIVYGGDVEKAKIEKKGWLIASSNLAFEPFDFPDKDSIYHNYAELTSALQKLAQENPNIVQMSSIAKTQEGRDIWSIRLSGNLASASELPGIIFMGGHHAREHLSVEMPLLWIQYLVREYKAGHPKIVQLLNSREIHVIPMVNPDGAEHDIASGQYKLWRKNRTRNSDGSYGVDLNRNYGYQWGTGGSSSSPGSDTFKGTQPFSEIETRAVRDYIEANQNITILLSFHSFSKLILYPWGHKYDGIEQSQDLAVHETMARKMAEWNGYAPQQSSDLYIASGDTTDWSYGVHKIISFTFELDPDDGGFGGSQGFYPGAQQIEQSFQKNIEPMMYLTDYADNPYRVLNVGIGPINP